MAAGLSPRQNSQREFPAHHFAEENGAAASQGAGQPHHLGPEIFDGQVLLQHHAGQDGLELGDAGALVGEKVAPAQLGLWGLQIWVRSNFWKLQILGVPRLGSSKFIGGGIFKAGELHIGEALLVRPSKVWGFQSWGTPSLGGGLQVLGVPHNGGGVGRPGGARSPPECGVMLWEKPVEKAAMATG